MGPVPSLFVNSKSNVLKIIKCIVLSYTSSISKNLVYLSDTVGLFLLFWQLLQWFLLYSILYCHIFTFSRTIPTFCSLQFLSFLNITIQSLLLLFPIGTNLSHRLLHTSLPGIPFFLPLFACQVVLDVSLNLSIFLVCFLSPFWRCTPPDTSWGRFWGHQFP